MAVSVHSYSAFTCLRTYRYTFFALVHSSVPVAMSSGNSGFFRFAEGCDFRRTSLRSAIFFFFFFFWLITFAIFHLHQVYAHHR